VSEPRRYVSPKREAQAAATRSAILDAFVEQLSDPGRNTLSPSEAAVRAGVSVRTVHLYFPNLESQVAAPAEATAMVLRLSGADASWPLHDSYGLPLDRIPGVIAHTVELIIRDLRTQVTDDRAR
jgi:AcrR family transcriptional regulator